jgi:IS30 family transposase
LHLGKDVINDAKNFKKGTRGVNPNRHFIDERPAVVEEKVRIGDWEVIRSEEQERGNVVTFVDRTTKYLIAFPLKIKQPRTSQECDKRSLYPQGIPQDDHMTMAKNFLNMRDYRKH